MQRAARVQGEQATEAAKCTSRRRRVGKQVSRAHDTTLHPAVRLAGQLGTRRSRLEEPAVTALYSVNCSVTRVAVRLTRHSDALNSSVLSMAQIGLG